MENETYLTDCTSNIT